MPPVCRAQRVFLLCAWILSTFHATAQVQIQTSKESALIHIDGELFTEYHVGDVYRPYFYPVIGPNGKGMTRNFPMKKGVEGEETDHMHHRGVWFGHRAVNGSNFWGDTPDSGRIVHKGFHRLTFNKKEGSFSTSNDWIAKTGETVCTDERIVRIYNHPKFRMMDITLTIKASHGDVVLMDEKDGGMATRLPHTMKVIRRDKKPVEGHILMSDGSTDAEAWGKRAKWCYSYGPVEGEQAGVAIFDHPGNPNHPTWWHARTYGLIAANAFGKGHFEKLSDKHAGDVRIASGESLTFKYRLIWNEGQLSKEQLDAEFRKFAAN